MAFESYVPKLSLAIITLISVYIFDWIFLFIDDFFSLIIKNLLESIINNVFTKSKFEFKKFWKYIPNFILFITSLLIILPFLIDFGISNLNPLLESYLNQNPFYFVIGIFGTFIVLYFLFKQFYYKLKKEQSNTQNLI